MPNKHQHTLLAFYQLTQRLRLALAIVDFDIKGLRQFVGRWWGACSGRGIGGLCSRGSHRSQIFSANQNCVLASSVSVGGALIARGSNSSVLMHDDRPRPSRRHFQTHTLNSSQCWRCLFKKKLPFLLKYRRNITRRGLRFWTYHVHAAGFLCSDPDPSPGGAVLGARQSPNITREVPHFINASIVRVCFLEYTYNH
jgi:hypothetical protein